MLQNTDDLFNEILKFKDASYTIDIIDSIINDKPLDIYKLYVQRFELDKTWLKSIKAKTIAEFDKNLDKTLCKNAELVSKRYTQWLEQIKQWPGYAEFVAKLKQLRAQMQIVDMGRGY